MKYDNITNVTVMFEVVTSFQKKTLNKRGCTTRLEEKKDKDED